MNKGLRTFKDGSVEFLIEKATIRLEAVEAIGANTDRKLSDSLGAKYGRKLPVVISRHVAPNGTVGYAVGDPPSWDVFDQEQR